MKQIIKFLIGIFILINFQSAVAITFSFTINSYVYSAARHELVLLAAKWAGITNTQNLRSDCSRKCLLKELDIARAAKYALDKEKYFEPLKSNKYGIDFTLNSFVRSTLSGKNCQFSTHEIDKLNGFAFRLIKTLETEQNTFEKLAKNNRNNQVKEKISDSKNDKIKSDSNETDIDKNKEYTQTNDKQALITVTEQ